MAEDKTFATRLNSVPPRKEEVRFDRIELFYQGNLIVVKLDSLPFYLGRDHSVSDLAVTGDTVSRKHCVFQLRDSQIGLLDTSTNGTYVRPGRAESICIHNEYYPLVGQGAIKLGQKMDVDDTDVLFYKVVTK